MIREIKFRAWDGGGMFEGVVVTPDGMWTDDIVRDHWHTGNVMQYTGLKDKNGKEIYEGDIIKCDKSFGKVIYRSDEQDCGFCIDWIKNPNHWNNYLHVRINELMIIGNIYERPELIK